MKMTSVQLGCSLAMALFSAVAWAQQPTAFVIKGYKVQGNSLLSPEVVRLSTQTHTGSESSFETIQLALESLEKAYLNAGYGSVRVEIPEQELDSGVVTLQVVEGVLGEVQVDPNAFFDADNVRHSLPALRLSETVNIHELNRNLMLANESGIKVTQVTFKRSAKTDLQFML